MRFARQQEGVVELSDTVLAHFANYRQFGTVANEAGGILLGRFIYGTRNVMVDTAEGPSKHDRRKRFSFFRRKKPAQTIVNEAWNASDGTSNYLGEWHTHPEDDPSPSATDLSDWQRIVKLARYEQDCLFFIIVGRSFIRVWEVCKENELPILLKAIE